MYDINIEILNNGTNIYDLNLFKISILHIDYL